MKSARTQSPTEHVLQQGFGAWVSQLNEDRRALLANAVEALKGDLKGQDRAFAASMGELDWARKLIGTPEHILGSNATKHGEVAEIAEVGVRRARDLLFGKAPNAFLSYGDRRLAPEDYAIGGIPVQSKFLRQLNQCLSHCQKHTVQYPDFCPVGGGYYHIPRDNYEIIAKVLAGEDRGLNPRSVDAIRNHVVQLETLGGRPFNDLVRPSIHSYQEVQQSQIMQTLDGHEKALNQQNAAIKKGIMGEHREDIEAAKSALHPSLHEAGKVGAAGAAVGAGLQLTVAVYQKWRTDGKLPTQFIANDWKDVGCKVSSGAATGSVSAVGIYLLTNYSALSAPFAAAVVSSGRVMVTLTKQYRAGDISLAEYTDLSVVATTEAGIAAAGAVFGQALIPVPILGAVIGSATVRLVTVHAKHLLQQESDVFDRLLKERFQEQVSALEREHRTILDQFNTQLLQLEHLMNRAFDVGINSRMLLLASIDVAKAYGVPDCKIIRTTEELDNYILFGNKAGEM